MSVHQSTVAPAQMADQSSHPLPSTLVIARTTNGAGVAAVCRRGWELAGVQPDDLGKQVREEGSEQSEGNGLEKLAKARSLGQDQTNAIADRSLTWVVQMGGSAALASPPWDGFALSRMAQGK